MDAELFLRSELEFLNIRCTDNEIGTILEKAEYNFDYLHYFLVQCEERYSNFLFANELPTGLTAMFQSDFEQRFPEDFYNFQIKPILQVLVVANEPLSVVDLSKLSPEKRTKYRTKPEVRTVKGKETQSSDRTRFRGPKIGQ